MFERCGSTESSNTNCVEVTCILMELCFKRNEVSRKEENKSLVGLSEKRPSKRRLEAFWGESWEPGHFTKFKGAESEKTWFLKGMTTHFQY